MTVLNLFALRYDPADSYGRIASELRTHLTRKGVQLNALSVEDTDEKPMLIKLAFGGLHLGYPETLDRFGALGQYGTRVTHTMFESTKLPDGWVERLNTRQGLSVPSKFVHDLMVTEGVRIPIEIHPLGVDVSTYRWTPRKRQKVFTVLAIADRGQRKGWHHAAFAFVKAFGNRSDVRLILKTRKSGLRMTILNPNMYVMSEDLTEQELARLYQSCDVMIGASSGEGFGLPWREYAATGGLCLATNWSGLADDLNQWGVPIPVNRLVPAWEGEKFEGLGEWAEPDTDALAAELVRLRDLSLHDRNDIGRVFALNVRRLYRWETFAAQLFRFWEGLADGTYSDRLRISA